MMRWLSSDSFQQIQITKTFSNIGGISPFPPRSRFRLSGSHTAHPHDASHFIIDQRSVVFFSPSDPVPNDAEDDNSSGNHNAVIHRRSRDRRCRRPEAPEDHEDHIDTCVCIVDDSEDAGNAEWSPCQFDLSNFNSQIGNVVLVVTGTFRRLAFLVSDFGLRMLGVLGGRICNIGGERLLRSHMSLDAMME